MFERARKTDPTPRQVEVLKNFGLTPPRTKAACSNNIGWLLEQKDNKDEIGRRVALLKAAELRFLGKKVRHPSERTGSVRHFLHESNSAVDEGRRQGPLVALVEWDGGKGSSKVSSVTFSSLTVVE